MALRNLDDLKVFIKAVDCGSFSAAARAMNLVPTSVSKQIARLERAIGTTLFERNTRRLKITEEGLAVADRTRAALALLQEAEEIAMISSDRLSGKIRITAPTYFGGHYVAAAIAAFRRLHPQVSFELQLSDRVTDLYASEVDIAIRIGALSDSRLIARRLANSRRILVASARYIKEHGCPASPSDLEGHRCLLFSYPGLTQNSWTLTKGSTVETVSVTGDLCTDSGAALNTWAKQGLGVALRESWAVAGALDSGRLVRVLPEWEEPSTPISIVRAKREPVPRRILAFITFMADAWREQPPWETRCLNAEPNSTTIEKEP